MMLALQRLQLKFVQDRTVASVFVVLNPSEPGDRVKAIAAMVGGFICTPDFVVVWFFFKCRLQSPVCTTMATTYFCV